MDFGVSIFATDYAIRIDELAREAELSSIKDDIEAIRPTIIDLEGNEQPTYDISHEMQAKKKPEPEA